MSDRLGLTEGEFPSRSVIVAGVVYVGGGLAYQWSCDGRDGCMWVHVVLDLDDARYSVDLRRLVAGSRPAGDRTLLDNCRSWLVLQRAVASHAEWVERLHPRLIAPDAPDLILASGGSKVLPAMPDAARWRPCAEPDLP
ncbi:hypothetical protein BS329_20840 [Amycolatopsis coloradensis]|uniref:Uncharacterized protein n=1 Tax=Amycolatopsis coloradensis TaxID=76021 RepID=A0A1R0KQW1_9PSEU|nr:hypothetical protein BS329_20840 [Amycolatopsis coloradensis]